MPRQREVLVEFRRVGSIVKATAVDPETLVEVSVQGPASVGEASLKRTVLAKLEYVLARRRETR